MTFGKRSKGEGHPARDLLPPMEEMAPANIRMTSAKPTIDKGFLALAAGVVLVSGGAALAAPSVLDMFGNQVRPIEQVIAGLDRSQAKVALAREAFPDTEGRAFMSALQTSFPSDHDRLTTILADNALSGGDRTALVEAFNEWSVDFVLPNMVAISRTGAEGFDEFIGVIDGTIGLLDKTTGCTMPELMAFASNPEKLDAVRAYGSESYKFAMRSSTTLVKLAAKGRATSTTPDMLNKEDEQALMSLFFGIMSDPQVMQMMQSSRASYGAGPASMPNIDICKLGYAITTRLHQLPAGTKARVMGMTAQGAVGMDRQMLKDLVSGRGAMNDLMSGGLPPGMIPGSLN
ncbi:MAG TPA: hypothetical protein VGE73_09820 [Pseudolabrys sp.]